MFNEREKEREKGGERERGEGQLKPTDKKIPRPSLYSPLSPLPLNSNVYVELIYSSTSHAQKIKKKEKRDTRSPSRSKYDFLIIITLNN